MMINASREFSVIEHQVGCIELAAGQICDETVMIDLIALLAKLLSGFCKNPPLDIDVSSIIGDYGFLYDDEHNAKRPDSR